VCGGDGSECNPPGGCGVGCGGGCGSCGACFEF
jgi:hypothetical protein